MKVILSCGGTGGHIYPAIAIADKIKERHSDAEILFIGTKKGMENSLVPSAGYKIEGIDASGFDRKHLFNNFKTLSDVVKGTEEATQIIKSFSPDFVIGTGGYVTGPVLLKAHRLGYPCFVHEQNAIPGLANKVIAGFADKVFVSFKNTEKQFAHPDRTFYVGNPIRSSFTKLNKEESRAKLGLLKDDVMILVTSGSLGASVVNAETIKLIDEIKVPGIKLFFVTGKRYYDGVMEKLQGKDLSFAQVIPYADNMPELMSAADIVVSRAGAIAVSEITASGKPSILIPSPNVTNNHQYHNAKAIANAKAAIMIEEADIESGKLSLASEVLSLISRPEDIASMSDRAKAIGKTNSADLICDYLGI